jgi:hypothetical protein
MMTLDQIQPHDVIMNPENKTTMWRVEQLDKEKNRVRLVRSSKTGDIHGLVKDPQGSWMPAPDIAKFTVIGHWEATVKGKGVRAAAKKAGAAKTASAKPGKSVVHKAPVKPQAHKPRLEAGVPGASHDLLLFMRKFHQSMADGIGAVIGK